MKKSVRDVLRLNLQLIKFKPFIFILNFTIWLLISLVPLISGLLVKDIFTNLTTGDYNTYFIKAILLLLIVFLNGIIIREGGVVDTLTRFYIGQLVRKGIIKNAIEKKKVKIKSSGAVIDILEGDVEVLEELVSFEIDLLCKLIFFIGAIAILLNINFQMTILSVVPLIVISNIIWILGSKYKDKFSEVRKASIEYTSLLNEIINNREIVQFSNNKSSILKRFKCKCDNNKKASINKSVFNEAVNEIITLSNNLVLVLILVIFIKFYKEGSLTIGDLTLFISYFGYGYNFLELFNETYSNIKYSEDSIVRISNLLCCDTSNTFNVLNEDYVRKVYDINYEEPSLTLKNFKLCSEDKTHNIVIDKNDFVVICGENGSGKSKLINAITGYEEHEGEVLFYNKEAASNIEVSYVPQEPNFFDDTLKNNISVFNEQVDIRKASEAANLINNMNNWNLDSDEFVGVEAKRLSEGQRQRLAIARALANNKEIVVLDDSLSFLDKDNRKTIIQNIIDMNKTVIMVSNDEDIKKTADKVIEMKNLKIVNYISNKE